MGSSSVDLPPESIVSVFSYEYYHNGVPGTLFCQSINRSRYSRNWVDAEYPSEPWPDLRAAASLPDIIFPSSRAPI